MVVGGEAVLEALVEVEVEAAVIIIVWSRSGLKEDHGMGLAGVPEEVPVQEVRVVLEVG